MLSPEIYTFILAMSPVVESRGAIPYGVLAGVEPNSVILLSIAGNILPVPFLLLVLSKMEQLIIARPEKSWLRALYLRYIGSLRRKTKAKIDRYGFFGVMLFVAVPVPGSGAWTGSLLAHLFGLEKKGAFIAIIFGTVEAALIIYAFVTFLGFVF
ncbi:MAG: small multi-drug export protein [Candidatus Verstraetearchaeota archaeon]|nr:small multi-drug export protein [Candidatus Verstraetearchaeota archaeon]